MQGTKQGANVFQGNQRASYTDLGFEQALGDSCLYTLKHATGCAEICTHVDDAMAAFENDEVMSYVLDDPTLGLRTKNPGLTIEPWRKLVGFDVDVDEAARTIKWSARTQIQEMKDVHFGGAVITNPGVRRTRPS